jgi:NAD(P)-dependent dehydrogenase (short-subunit alcohol dehydrogenase family)
MTRGRLQDKSIVIIGGTAGLGLSAAQACAAQGASLVLVGRSASSCEQAQTLLGDAVPVMRGDAADPQTAIRAVAAAVERNGRLDGLYHVAGGSGRSAGDGPLHEISPEGWQATLQMNLAGLFYSNQAAVRRFLEQASGGSVLNMSSVLAFAPSARYFATHAYAAAKAAAMGLTRACAAYYAPQNIRFNVLAPALVETPMAERALGDPPTMNYVRGRQPLDGGRAGRPQDLDEAVVYFLSDESRFVTGQTLAIDGGWSVSG